MIHTRTNNTYIIRISKGENVISSMTNFCKAEGVENAGFSAIGAVEYIECGYYELKGKEYHFKEYNGLYEVLNATGNVTLKDGAPFIHMHATFSGTDNQAFGGHVSEMRVGVVLEVVLQKLDTKVERQLDEPIGLYLMNCGSEQ